MNKILNIFFFIYKNPKIEIAKFILFSILALILEIISIGAIYPVVNSIFYNNHNFILSMINLNVENKTIIIILCVIVILVFFLKNIYYFFFYLLAE